MTKSGTRSSATSTGGKSRSPARSAGRSAGSSRSGARDATSERNITIVSRDFPRKGKTDWARVDALTDEDIAEAVANDPDAVPIDIDWSDAVLVVPPRKKAISIRVDEDVLDFFKREGEGYQRRMNAVLRSYMQQKSKPKKRA
ncbi:BrnA antitoxin family protein [Bradyrhizobium diazoefficiens]|nr:BrnA antitoxin family protein [Bradyrhizobium diazoefficiens]